MGRERRAEERRKEDEEREEREQRRREDQERRELDRKLERDEREQKRKDDAKRGGVRHKGQVVAWHDDKGFGFIRPDKGYEDIFAHISALIDGDAMREGDYVTYDEIFDERKG